MSRATTRKFTSGIRMPSGDRTEAPPCYFPSADREGTAASEPAGSAKRVISLIMGETIRPRPCTHHEDLLRKVSGLCNNANQLAHQANSTGRAEQKSVEKMIELTRKVYNAVKINW